MYTQNFKLGVDVKRFRPGVVGLAAIIGLVGGGLIGFGLDRLGERQLRAEKFK